MAYSKRMAKDLLYYKARPCGAGMGGGSAGRSGAGENPRWKKTQPSPMSPWFIADDLRRAQSRSPRWAGWSPPPAKRLLIDAMSAFGAIELNIRDVAFDAVAASSTSASGRAGSRLRALPQTALPSRPRVIRPRCRSTSMTSGRTWKDQPVPLHPPIHCIVAFDQAMTEHETGRRRPRARRALPQQLEDPGGGMRGLGFETLLPDRLRGAIIVTFHMPADGNFRCSNLL